MKRESLQEIMERAILEAREVLEEDGEEAADWDPDAYEQVVRQFTQELGLRLL